MMSVKCILTEYKDTIKRGNLSKNLENRRALGYNVSIIILHAAVGFIG